MSQSRHDKRVADRRLAHRIVAWAIEEALATQGIACERPEYVKRCLGKMAAKHHEQADGKGWVPTGGDA